MYCCTCVWPVLNGQRLVHRRRRSGSCRGSRRTRRGSDTVPALRQHMIASRSACARSVASPTTPSPCRSTASMRPGAVRLAPDRVDAPVRPAALRHLHQPVVDRLLRRSRSSRPCPAWAIFSRSGTRSMAITRPAPSIQRAADGELADRPAAPDRDRVARLDLGLLGGHVAGREDVRQEQHLLVGQAVGHLHGAGVGGRTRRYSACPPAYPPIRWRVAVQPGRGLAHHLAGRPRRSGWCCRSSE